MSNLASNLRDRVHLSCESLLKETPSVVDIDSHHLGELVTVLKPLVTSETRDGSIAAPQALRFPLKFKDVEHEITFFALLQALKFGAVYAPELYRLEKTHLEDNIQRGCIAMFISGDLSADRYVTMFMPMPIHMPIHIHIHIHMPMPMSMPRLTSLTITDIEQLFRLPLSRDERVQDAPMYMAAPTKIRPFAERILSILHECGRVLRARQFQNLGSFITSLTCSNASEFAEELAKVFPNTFNDVITVKGTTISFLSKCQCLAESLYARFKDEDGVFSGWNSLEDLSVFANMDLVSILSNEHVLTAQKRSPDVTVAQAWLRAASVVAVHQIATKLDTDIGTVQRALEVLRKQKKKKGSFSFDLPVHVDSTSFF